MATENQEFLLHWHLYWTVTGIFFGGGGGQPHFPSIYTSYLYTHNTVKEMNGNREPRFSITLTLLLDGNEFLLGGGGDMERGDIPLPPSPHLLT